MNLSLRSRGFAATSALVLTSATLFACGGDSDDSGDTSATSTPTVTDDAGGAIDPALAAQSLADCTTQAGLDGKVTDTTTPNAAAVDMTTEDTTIIVQVFATAEEAGAYKNQADLDQEVVDNYVIVGGTISRDQHEIIANCISG